MRRTIDHHTAAPTDRVRSVIGDLTTYSDWLTIVDRAEPAPPHADDAGPAWFVTLRARLGRFSRAKRLRMVRTVDTDGRVVFERHEHDGRRHSRWVLSAEVAADGDDRGSAVRFDLDYDGGLLEPVVSRLLDGEIEESRPRLETVLSQG
ncbi:MAG: SRPBCC family protein [Actinomycetota bacterium]